MHLGATKTHSLNVHSVSHDRTAVVWQPSDDSTTWQPCQVVMRLKRAALCTAWAPTPSRKFAVGSASGTIAVCFPDATQGWFASKPIKRKHSGSVMALAWAPNGSMLATASTDGYCHVLCAGIKGAGGAASINQVNDWTRFLLHTLTTSYLAPTEVDGAAPLAAFGSVLYEVDVGAGWVHGVCWSPSGVVCHLSGLIAAANRNKQVAVHRRCAGGSAT